MKFSPKFLTEVATDPVLTCSESVDFEKRVLTDECDEWKAMLAVGKKLGLAIRFDFGICRCSQTGISVLGLIGKGHNGGDALLAIYELLHIEGFVADVSLLLVGSVSDLKPNTRRALEMVEGILSPRVFRIEDLDQALAVKRFALCIDGLVGMQFKPPAREPLSKIIALINDSESFDFKCAVDLPSGYGEESESNVFRADFTYATGIYKSPLLEAASSGIVRYLDIGFFGSKCDAETRVIKERILDPLRELRSARSEKRQHGHLAIVAGSRSMPGALAMCVHSALKSGVGLITVFAPESIVSQLAVNLPEAMWKTWPETPEGGLALEGLWQIQTIEEKASALLLGPGMGQERETLSLVQEIVSKWRKPLILDADALRTDIVSLAKCPCILTPHDGEFLRISEGLEPSDHNVLKFSRMLGLTIVKKGPSTRVSNGENLFVNSTGNSVLSRGGSGDILAGLVAGLFAQYPNAPTEAACAGVYWHGKAADLLARAKGQTSVRATDLLDFLPEALDYGEVWNPRSPVSRPIGP